MVELSVQLLLSSFSPAGLDRLASRFPARALASYYNSLSLLTVVLLGLSLTPTTTLLHNIFTEEISSDLQVKNRGKVYYRLQETSLSLLFDHLLKFKTFSFFNFNVVTTGFLLRTVGVLKIQNKVNLFC